MVNELVQKLSEGEHEVSINERGETLEELESRIKDGFIHIKFIKTQGGTELGINIDKDNSNIEKIDFDKGLGKLHLEGTTTLNYNEVKCIADINMGTFKGKGYLQVINNKNAH